jgi:hypothetical protein
VAEIDFGDVALGIRVPEEVTLAVVDRLAAEIAGDNGCVDPAAWLADFNPGNDLSD